MSKRKKKAAALAKAAEAATGKVTVRAKSPAKAVEKKVVEPVKKAPPPPPPPKPTAVERRAAKRARAARPPRQAPTARVTGPSIKPTRSGKLLSQVVAKSLPKEGAKDLPEIWPGLR